MESRPRRIRRPSPAMVVALVALFFSLGGAAVATTTAIVPLAKRALTADNAKKLGKQTLAQVVATPGPASSAAGLVTVESTTVTIGPGADDHFEVACDAGQRAIGGGLEWKSGPDWWWGDHFPTEDGGSWRIYINNSEGSAPGVAEMYAICLA